MILIHRVTPFLIGLMVAAGFAGATFGYGRVSTPILFGLGLLTCVFLFSRLVGYRQIRHFQFWYLVGTPSAFIASSYGIYLFLESPTQRLVLVALTALLALFFAEHVFHYIHIPSNYQAYAIEHLSLVLNVLTMFFVGSVAFGLQLFLQLPLWLLSAIFFLVSAFVIYGTLWVSKVEHAQGWPYALSGAVLTTELFSVVTFLPTGFYTNAALLALFFYLFLGLTRAHFTQQLTQPTVRRYLLIGSGLFAAIVGTARWM